MYISARYFNQRNYVSNVYYVSKHWKHSTALVKQPMKNLLIKIYDWFMLLHLQEEDWPFWEVFVVVTVCSSMDLPPPVHTAPYSNDE